MKPFRPALLVLVALGLLTTPALARKRGHAGPPPTEDQQAVQSLHKQIAAAELLQALALDAEQTATLRDVVAQVVAEQEARQAEQSADAPKLRAILETYLADVQASGQPSQASADALAAFQAGKKAERDEGHEAMRALHQRLRDLLDEDQKRALAEFEPSIHLGPGPEERMERRERRGGDGRERGFDGDEGPDPERMERRMQRRKIGMLMRHLVFSPEMLAALQ
jgi:hypothetical protein